MHQVESHRHENNHLLPLLRQRAERLHHDAGKQGQAPATLGAVAKKAVTGVGAPSYTSGDHIWNGTADTLKHSPMMISTMPTMTPLE